MGNFVAFTLYRNNTCNNLGMVSYPIVEKVTNLEIFKRAVSFDHVFAEYKDGVNKYGQPIIKHRKNANFINSDVIALDVDNGETDNPSEWVTIEKLQQDFSDVTFAVATSRNHMLPKTDNQGITHAPRPKFHLYFPIPKIHTSAEYTKIKTLTVKMFPYFDPNAVDCARIFVGNKNRQVYYFSGKTNLSEYILAKQTVKTTIPYPAPQKKGNFSSSIPQGSRNNEMHKIACSLLKKYGDSPICKTKYNEASQKCTPQLDVNELHNIFTSALKWYNEEVLPNPDYIRPTEFGSVLKQQENQAIVWQKITPIMQIIPKKYPVSVFPKILQTFISAVSEFSETSPEMCGTLLLGVLGGIFQKKYEVMSTAGNTEQLSIFSLAIAEPAERKSGVIKLVTRSLEIFEEAYNEANKEEISANIADKKLLAKKLVLAEKGDDDQALYNAQAAFDNFTERRPLELLADDTTPEALCAKMKNQGERVIVTASEGGFFKKIKGRYTPNGADTEIYLKAHSGDRHSVDRIGRPADILKKPAISIVMTCQNSIVNTFISDEEMSGNGMTARFLYAFCEEMAGNSRHPFRQRKYEDYNAVFERFNDLIVTCLNRTVESQDTKILKMSTPAYEFACNYFYKCEKRIKIGIERAKGWNGKSFGLAMRIAGLFHLIECFETNTIPEETLISSENIQRAGTLVDCYAEHAEKAFSPNDKTNCDALYLLDKIKQSGLSEMSKGQLFRLARKFKTADELTEPLELLVANGYLSTNFLATGGRPTEKICVNPNIKQG